MRSSSASAALRWLMSSPGSEYSNNSISARRRPSGCTRPRRRLGVRRPRPITTESHFCEAYFTNLARVGL